MSRDDVAAVVGPPPRSSFPVDWGAVEQRLGVRLPQDYKDFAQAYGPVLVGEWLWVFVPHQSEGGGYFADLARCHNLQRVIRNRDPDAHPYAFHPEPGGLLAWGMTRRTDVFFWDPSASTDPNQWPTCAYCKTGGNDAVWRTFAVPALQVIVALVRGDLDLHPDMPRLALPGGYAPVAWPVSPLGFDDQPPVGPAPAELRNAGRALAATVRVDPIGREAPWEVPFGAAGSLPEDYVALIERVGPGTLAGTLRLLAPGAGAGFDIDTEHARHAERLRDRRAAGRRVVPAPLAPAPAGMRLWGVFTSGETCWWLPADRTPSDWPLVLVDAEGVGWQRLERTTTQFLTRWLDGRLDLPVLSLPPLPLKRTLTAAGHQAAAPLRAPGAIRDALAQLQTIIGAAPTPRTYDWEATEREVGVPRLPTDYKRLLRAHGSAVINGFLTIYGISIADPDELVSSHQWQAGYLRDWWTQHPRDAGRIHPEPGGLLLCATTEGRDILWWDTSRPNPDQWTITWDVEFDRHTFAGTLTELLVADFTGRLDPPLTGAGLSP
jgi:hypothetical protein